MTSPDEASHGAQPVAVHCFFRCGHIVRSFGSQAAHEAMEAHYEARHEKRIAALVGQVT